MLSAPSLSSPSACRSPAAPSWSDTSARLRAGATRTRVSGSGSSGGHESLAHPDNTTSLSADANGYSSSLREALVPLVADHKCSSPEVYGADISPNMLCAGYFDCKADACQVSPASDLPTLGRGTLTLRATGSPGGERTRPAPVPPSTGPIKAGAGHVTPKPNFFIQSSPRELIHQPVPAAHPHPGLPRQPRSGGATYSPCYRWGN